MKQHIILSALFLFSFSSFAQKKKDLIKEVAKLKSKTIAMEAKLAEYEKAKELDLKDSLQNFSYAYGVGLGSQLKSVGIDTVSYNAFALGLKDVLKGDEKIAIKSAEKHTKDVLDRIQDAKNKLTDNKGKEFLAENAKREEIVITESGLQYQILTQGDGLLPKENNKVTVHYTGMLIDGKVFDSSVERGEPAVFGVTQVIKGWQEVLQLMQVGSKWKVYIPQELAYGARNLGNGLIPPYSMLIFEMELLEIKE